MALSLLLGGCSREPTSAADSAPAEGRLASVTAPQLLAKVKATGAQAILVNAWATWCGSCEHELPMLQKLAQTYGDKGVRVLLVSVDEASGRAQVGAFLDQHAITLTTYLAAGSLGAFKQGMNPRWSGVLPASFLFDRQGKLRYFWAGEAYEGEVVPVVEGLLAGKAIDGEANLGVAPGVTTDHH